ncbi:MAG: succinate--CoA ligase subunit alpha [Candidatus Edwardsbacteria bacterium RIFOXYD12_FULL_50_11]|jgi:succinyl-CoA synthetase alpha subunit|uniref:Succinate--CoA ligase [ADP-forming] subunit alpha n=1 Tax=Candidatus Edwardsbacteria bacterium GWF2_54_11 TaxID=1817851 RepID=A0A1F5R4F5_9BACT|nr:MAG: succinate--CoA ligase subunit alpha [Candidatus Edwardsbacteria bacterium RifOxyC12_full_54_24]OGF07312.1 MAG: succinate--CoA ligase subunit alpha [Candidatus Edwardsbacteria bacterium RifOxyA12_full_54_48]OGF09306.1 MAG: succinate--CoA ligase subunit alpha [Candidatus Edwardsbacteria bacterium GWF2_54_11]OGF09565.1 MAG: succinate--CoA ligase subunit alpha [Candidatus Edwardsbacteria bacterium GWE2_54_12]OGF17170.1 MAG: succinate--CoA ligase subunit alpha [Candidatus Edwardsbacteria bac
MAILIDQNTRLVCQGFTGKHGTFHTLKSAEYGTRVVGGVVPGKGGTIHEGFPVFDTVAQAREKGGANTSMIFVPANFCKDALIEAIDAEMELVICITEGVPVNDMLFVKRYLMGKRTRLIGPNCPGVISPGLAKAGIMPASIHKKGGVGVISRSGTLTYEAVNQLTQMGIGQSTCLGIGGDPVIGTTFIDAFELFKKDRQTKAVLMIGEIGGSMEEETARWIKKNFDKPVAAFIAGATAPKGKRMGHAGAIISGGKGTYQEKVRVLKSCGIKVAKSPAEMGKALKSVL